MPNERKDLLKEKIDEYVSSMETACHDYDNVATDRLLILEALNDWSSGQLAEGGAIKFDYRCDDPACASEFEARELVSRMHAPPVILYPVSGFSLSDDDRMQFNYFSAAYRLAPHSGGRRSEAIQIAQSSRIRDVEAAMNLWGLCATEDCLEYLRYLLDEHGMWLEKDSESAARQLISSALLSNFSIGQIWNATWRAVKDAAALSTRQYFNAAKASKTVPKKIDKVLTQNVACRGGFAAYDRIAALPMGAVLTLLLHRFGIEDDTPGPEVRAKFMADAALAPPRPGKDRDDDSREVVTGTMYFAGEMTPLDRLVLSCFNGLHLADPEPVWDEDGVMGQIQFSLDNIYAFDGYAFLCKVLDAGSIPHPSIEDLQRHAALAREQMAGDGKWADTSGRTGAMLELFSDQSEDFLDEIRYAAHYPMAPRDVIRLLRSLPVRAGLTAIRTSYVGLFEGGSEHSDDLAATNLLFDLPETVLSGSGSDAELIRAAHAQNVDQLAEMISSSILRSVIVHDPLKEAVWKSVAERLLNNFSGHRKPLF